MLRLLHPLDRRLDGVDPRLDPPRGRHLPRRLGLGRQPLRPALVEGAAVEGRLRLRARLLHARRRRVRRHDQVGRQDAARREDGRPRRRPSRHRGVHLVQGQGGAQGARPRAGRLRHVARLARLGLDPVPEREQLRPRQRRVHGGGRRRARSSTSPPAPTAPSSRPSTRASCCSRSRDAAWECADPGVQYDTTINSWHTLPNTGRINASNPCSEYMSIDDSACNLASLNLMKFRREDGEFDVEAFEHACDVVFLAQEILVGYSSYPTPEIGRNAKRVPPARARLREPRRAADGARAAVRLRRGSRVRGGDHGAHDRPRVSQVGRDRGADGAVRRLPGQPRADDRRDREASRGGRQHRARRRPCRPTCSAACRKAWDDALEPRRDPRLPQRAGDRARSDRDDQLHDGLRHDRRRARLLARQVEEARRRRRDHDREQDGADRRSSSSATRRARSTRSSRSSTSATRVVGAPYVKTEHYPVFDCAVGERAIHYSGHVKMMGAVQPFISGAISKTVNLPEEATVEDVIEPLRRRVEARRQGDRDLPRQLQGRAAALELRQGRADGGRDAAGARARAQAPAARPHRGRPQVPGRRPRGLHPRRPLRRRQPGRHLRRHRQGRHDDGRPDELALPRRLDGPPVRRAARGLRLEALRTCASSRAA